uniref:Catalase n=1 Tax=uncultured bacterium contig00103 TaxID=1181570 RepID=A0A806KHK2_9BACT|nr:hypothetical protein [uncultured bacterium contig00103]
MYKPPVSLLGQQKEKKEAYELYLSEEGWKILGDDKPEKPQDAEKTPVGATIAVAPDGEEEENISETEELSEEEQRQLDELKRADKKVRAHEQAHVNAAGGYARGGANYDYVTGPDGKRYASSGHVNLDVSPEKKPEETVKKAEVIKRAALAPTDPSPSDRQIAANAQKMAADAQRELAVERMRAQEAVA